MDIDIQVKICKELTRIADILEKAFDTEIMAYENNQAINKEKEKWEVQAKYYFNSFNKLNRESEEK